MSNVVNFRPISTTQNVTLTASNQRIEIGDGPVNRGVRIFNGSNSTAFVAFGDSTVVAAAATGIPIPSGGVEAFTVAPNATHVAIIGTGTPTGLVYVTEGLGL